MKSRNSPAGIYLFKDNSGNNRTICEICSMLTNNKDIRTTVSDVDLVSLSLNLNWFHTLLWYFLCWLKQVNAGRKVLLEVYQVTFLTVIKLSLLLSRQSRQSFLWDLLQIQTSFHFKGLKFFLLWGSKQLLPRL